MKASNYDKAIKENEQKIKDAEQKGYLRGKNEKIVLKKTEKNNTDGLPDLSSSSKEKETQNPDWIDKVSSRRRY